MENTAERLGFRMRKAEHHHRMAASPVKVQAIWTWVLGRGSWVVGCGYIARVATDKSIGIDPSSDVCRCLNYRHSNSPELNDL